MTKQTIQVIELDLSADELVAGLLTLDPSRGACVLDSGGARAEDARYLIGGFDPVETVEAYGDQLKIRSSPGYGPELERGSILDLLDRRLRNARVTRSSEHELPVSGSACVAAFGYDLSRQFEKSPRYATAWGDQGLDATLAFFEVLAVHDYATRRSYVVGKDTATTTLKSVKETIQTEAAHARLGAFDRRLSTQLKLARSNFTREQYIAAVERIREHIFAGDIYQANLTQQITCEPSQDSSAEAVFWRLRTQNPAAFAAFVRFGNGVIVSASPERFIRIKSSMLESSPERIVDAWPIKGTRPRGRDKKEDARLAAELLASGKDAAENVMIVDLMRNDLGRVCKYGSVTVEELCMLQEHPTLFHLVSKVRGVLREGKTVGDLIRATFPSGSITGAPKLRAMQILRDVETVARGFSMGALGYFSSNSELDLNVAIRTITFTREGLVRFNVGGGIVAESDPVAEFDESLLKAKALLRALRAELVI